MTTVRNRTYRNKADSFQIFREVEEQEQTLFAPKIAPIYVLSTLLNCSGATSLSIVIWTAQCPTKQVIARVRVLLCFFLVKSVSTT